MPFRPSGQPAFRRNIWETMADRQSELAQRRAQLEQTAMTFLLGMAEREESARLQREEAERKEGVVRAEEQRESKEQGEAAALVHRAAAKVGLYSYGEITDAKQLERFDTEVQGSLAAMDEDEAAVRQRLASFPPGPETEMAREALGRELADLEGRNERMRGLILTERSRLSGTLVRLKLESGRAEGAEGASVIALMAKYGIPYDLDDTRQNRLRSLETLYLVATSEERASISGLVQMVGDQPEEAFPEAYSTSAVQFLSGKGKGLDFLRGFYGFPDQEDIQKELTRGGEEYDMQYEGSLSAFMGTLQRVAGGVLSGSTDLIHNGIAEVAEIDPKKRREYFEVIRDLNPMQREKLIEVLLERETEDESTRIRLKSYLRSNWKGTWDRVLEEVGTVEAGEVGKIGEEELAPEAITELGVLLPKREFIKPVPEEVKQAARAFWRLTGKIPRPLGGVELLRSIHPRSRELE